MAFQGKEKHKNTKVCEEEGILNNDESGKSLRGGTVGQVSKGQMKKSCVSHTQEQNMQTVVSKVFYRWLLVGPTLKNVNVGRKGDSMMKSIWDAEIYKVKHGFNWGTSGDTQYEPPRGEEYSIQAFPKLLEYSSIFHRAYCKTRVLRNVLQEVWVHRVVQ